MILTANNRVTIDRLEEASGEKTYADEVDTSIAVYIEPYEDEIALWFDGQWAYNVFRMFSDTEIIQGDKLTDKDDVVYKVKWVRYYNSIVWNHYEATIQSIYD